MTQGAMGLRVFPLAPGLGARLGGEVVHFSSVALLAVQLNATVHVEENGWIVFGWAPSRA